MPLTYSFRIRFKQSPTDKFQTESTELELCAGTLASPLRLVNPSQGQPILQAEELVLTQSGHQSREAAEAAGERFQAALMLALARHRVGADFGSRAPKGVWTGHGLTWLEQQTGIRILNSVHGIMVYQTEPEPRFAMIKAKSFRGVDPPTFCRTFQEAMTRKLPLTDRDFLALSLFNTSFFQRSGDSRFLMLMMAIEALLELPLRSASAQEHVESMIALTRQADISQTEKDSMIGSLKWLSRESISQTGRLLMQQHLGQRMYLDMTAPDFFTHCYRLRSNLVHGNKPYPTFDKISSTVGHLEVMVSDLLTIPTLGLPT